MKGVRSGKVKLLQTSKGERREEKGEEVSVYDKCKKKAMFMGDNKFNVEFRGKDEWR